MKRNNPSIESRARAVCGSIVGEETGGGNLRLYKTHTPGDSIVIERADLDDLMVVLDDGRTRCLAGQKILMNGVIQHGRKKMT